MANLPANTACVLPPSDRTPKVWRVGTLTYTTGGLASLFCWLLLGDFAWSLRDRVVPPVMQLLFKKFGASDALTGLLYASLPAMMGLIIGPVVGYKSDRTRTRRGRRLPFLLFSIPFIVVSITSLAFCAQLGEMLHRLLGIHSPGLAASVLIFVGLAWTVFEISVTTAASVFGGLVNDVVPQLVLGRCAGLFRTISLFAAILFNYWLFGNAQSNYTWIFLGVGAVYGIGFSLMCLNVKEGEYPPPPVPSGVEKTSAISAIKAYFRDAFGQPFYLWFFAASLLATFASSPVSLFSVFYAQSLSMSMPIYGKCLALTYCFSFVLAYPLGYVADRFHPLRMTILMLLLYWMAMAYGFLFAHDSATFAIALVVHGVISGCQFTVIASLGQRLLPRTKFTEISSAGGLLGNLTGIVFAPLLGIFLDFTHHQYRDTFLVGLIISVLALGALLVLHHKFMALGGPVNYVAPD
jgi:MFS family permease